MSKADELRKYKELLDAGIITDTEFEDHKRQLLENTENEMEIPASPKPTAKPKKRIPWKTIIIVAAAIVAAVLVFFGVKAVKQHLEELQSNAYAEELLAPYMDKYGLHDYKVTDSVYSVDIYCEEFEGLSDFAKAAFLFDLEDSLGEVEDPQGGAIDFQYTEVYVDDNPASYEYVSTTEYRTQVAMKSLFGDIHVVRDPGLYYADMLILASE